MRKFLSITFFSGFILAIYLVSHFPALAEAEAATQASPNPLHGIHAPVGFRWTDNDRANLAGFHNQKGGVGAPGLVVALSVDMTAANNAAQVRMEQDLREYQAQGSQILVRMYPQRFPGGIQDAPNPARNTVSGSADDAAEDILRFVQEQEARSGWHFTNIIPGNEMNIEWPNRNYEQNLLYWTSNDDPRKYQAINQFMLELFAAWKQRVAQPAGRRFADVNLFFPALAQDGAPTHFGGFYFYAGDQPAGSKYDLLRPAIETLGHFSWHNYWRPGHAWEDRAIANFPDWLKHALNGQGTAPLPGYITESGWSPQAMTIAQPDALAQVWRRLAFLYWPAPPGRRDWFTNTQDDVLAGQRFEDDLQYFLEKCSGAAYQTAASAPGVAVWVAGSNGGFPEAAGLWGKSETSRWLHNYANWNL